MREEKRTLIEKIARNSITQRAFLHTWLAMPPVIKKITLKAHDGTEITLDYDEDKDLVEEVLNQLLKEEEGGQP